MANGIVDRSAAVWAKKPQLNMPCGWYATSVGPCLQSGSSRVQLIARNIPPEFARIHARSFCRSSGGPTYAAAASASRAVANVACPHDKRISMVGSKSRPPIHVPIRNTCSVSPPR